MIDRARRILANSQRLFILTGAGISAESGVPTFRGSGGLTAWRGIPFEQLSSADMVAADLSLVWEWFDYRRSAVGKCEPNAGHRVIAEAAKNGRFADFTLVTQNIDGLHAEAGSTGIIELHGNVNQARCPSCGCLRELGDLPKDERPPVCPECAAPMRPNVVLFGEMLPVGAMLRARDKAEACDVCFVVGTSALVYPANELPVIAKRAGAFVVEINPEPTVLTPICDVSIRANSSGALPRIFGI